MCKTSRDGDKLGATMETVLKAIGVALGLGIGVWGVSQSEANVEKMIERYQLDAAQTEFAKSCISTLDRFDKKFRGGAKDFVGCGCIATELGKTKANGRAPDYDLYEKAFHSVVKYSETNSNSSPDILGMFKHMTEVQDISAGEAMLLATKLGETVDQCKAAKLPEAPIEKAQSGTQVPYQPTVTDAPSNDQGCEGLSASSIETLQKIADRDGKSLEQICASVIS